MDYRVEDLAARAGVGVDTVRFYQAKRLLPPPRRAGRVALYDDAHLERLRRIRALLEEGFTLQLIGRLFARERERTDRALAEALLAESVGERSYSRAELAAAAGVPEALVEAARSAGLVAPLPGPDGEERYGEADLRMARAGLAILQAGFPLADLFRLAAEHARHVTDVTDRAIDLFDDHVRKQRPAPEVTAAFRELLPQVTRLVALHFQRTLVNRALERLARGEEEDALREALAATESAHLEVTWR
jgi:DNA-binding transcriptional MerR regulator